MKVGDRFTTTSGAVVEVVVIDCFGCESVSEDLIVFSDGGRARRDKVEGLIHTGVFTPIPKFKVGDQFQTDEGVIEVTSVTASSASAYTDHLDYLTFSNDDYHQRWGLEALVSSGHYVFLTTPQCLHTNKKWYESFTKAFWVCSDCGEDL